MSILRQEGPYPWHHDHNNPITTLKEYNPMSGTPLANEAAKALNPQPDVARSRIDFELEHLHEAIVNIDSSIERLFSKLSPVLGPASPNPGAVGEDRPEMSATAWRIREMAERIVELRAGLEELHDRLEC